MSKFMNVLGIIILVVILLIYFLTYGFPWNRLSSAYVVQSDQVIEKIDFTVNEDSNLAHVLIYLHSDGGSSKLATGDTVSLNSQIVKSKYYNTGASTGYKYTLELPKAQEYILSIKRAGKEEEMRSIKTQPLFLDIPAMQSKSEDLIIPYKGSFSEERLYVKFSSTGEDPGTQGNKGTITASGSRELELANKARIETTRIIIEKEELKRLKIGPVKLLIGASFKQEDGVLVVATEKEVEIVE